MVSFKDSACLPWSGSELRRAHESRESVNKAPVSVLSTRPAMKARLVAGLGEEG